MVLLASAPMISKCLAVCPDPRIGGQDFGHNCLYKKPTFDGDMSSSHILNWTFLSRATSSQPRRAWRR